jgi:hypothetical protein
VPAGFAEAGVVETDVRPGRAAVRLDAQEVGQARDFNGTWDRLWVKPGDHVLEFSRPGYMTLRVSVAVPRGGYVRIDETLQKGEGLDPRSASGAEPESDAPAQLPAPVPSLSEPEGGLRRALLRLDVEPLDAAVYLDGEFLARADEISRLHGALPVATGVHRIEIVRPGYRSRVVDVDVAGDEPVRLAVVLERESGGPGD